MSRFRYRCVSMLSFSILCHPQQAVCIRSTARFYFRPFFLCMISKRTRIKGQKEERNEKRKRLLTDG